MSDLFLCYDLKGIQSFIFQVPRLRRIVGGSALVDRFDRETAPNLAATGAELLFSGGGKGAFRCDNPEVAGSLKATLIAEAHTIGAGIQFGMQSDFAEAAHAIDSYHPYLPPVGPGLVHPCSDSGLYPVKDRGLVHPVIQRREYSQGDRMNRWFEERIVSHLTPEAATSLDGRALSFFSEIAATDGADAAGRAAHAALGARNRWAVIAMDGNDVGSQFAAAAKGQGLAGWVGHMGKALDAASFAATIAGMAAVLKEWATDRDTVEQATLDGKAVILPLRPLVVGGDDIVVLCHAAHAMTFVQAACTKFAEAASDSDARYRAESKDSSLWPATGGKISISAGVLFCSTGLPLSSAIPYAESLLASAKHKGRALKKGRDPAPACVDWEHVTESLLDHPGLRRMRELRFVDMDLGHEVVELTRRPYTVEGVENLLKLCTRYRDVPGTIRHQIQRGLRAGFWDRQVMLARLGKHQDKLAADLAEEADRDRKANKLPKDTRWERIEDSPGIGRRHTDVIDALQLMEEASRMERQTQGGKA